MEPALTPKNQPRQRQNDQVRCHVQCGIDVIELGLVKAGALDGLVPIKVQRTALEEQGDREGTLGRNDPCSDAIEGLPPGVVWRQHSDEEQNDGQLDDAQ